MCLSQLSWCVRDNCLQPVANAFLIVTAPAVCSVFRVTASDDKHGVLKSAGAEHSSPQQRAWRRRRFIGMSGERVTPRRWTSCRISFGVPMSGCVVSSREVPDVKAWRSNACDKSVGAPMNSQDMGIHHWWLTAFWIILNPPDLQGRLHCFRFGEVLETFFWPTWCKIRMISELGVNSRILRKFVIFALDA